jgi:two-component system, sensor histidine kinase ChiS
VIGHERFMQGTAISDAVNLASRLEGLTKAYGVSLVVSSDVLFGLQDPNRYSYRFLDRVPVRGKKEAVPVYEIFDSDPPAVAAAKAAGKERFERGVYEYHAWRYDAALKLFDEISTEAAPDAPAEIYRARCRKALAGGTASSGEPA